MVIATSQVEQGTKTSNQNVDDPCEPTSDHLSNRFLHRASAIPNWPGVDFIKYIAFVLRCCQRLAEPVGCQNKQYVSVSESEILLLTVK